MEEIEMDDMETTPLLLEDDETKTSLRAVDLTTWNE